MKPKKDLNYIAKVEQAIAKKYGEEAIQNPAKFWDEEKEKKYLKDVKKVNIRKDKGAEKTELDGFFIPKKLVNRDTNRTCPVCDVYSFDVQDDVYMSKYECCFKCYVEYIEGKEDRKVRW